MVTTGKVVARRWKATRGASKRGGVANAATECKYARRSNKDCKATRKKVKGLQANSVSRPRQRRESGFGDSVKASASADFGPSGSEENGETLHTLPKFVAYIRAVLFIAWTSLLSLPLICVMIAVSPFVYLFDRKRRRLNHLVNQVWAWLSILPFFRVKISGRENLPPSTTGAVYVANHQSIMDIFVLFLLGKPFKFVSKIEVFYVPIIGLAMYLTGHVALKRMDGRSQAQTFKQCINLLKEGVSILVFPEGTRSRDGKIKAFKSGAFKMARRGEAPVVPISLDGTSKVMPHGSGFLRFYPGVVNITIHEATQLTTDVDEWMQGTKEQISSAM